MKSLSPQGKGKELYKHKYATLMVRVATLKKLKVYAIYKNMTLIDVMEELANDFDELRDGWISLEERNK